MRGEDSIALINADLIECRMCARLVEWRERVAREKRKSYADQEYWGRPVPIFGDPAATHLILGLAPGAHGANRTGRMFTGDRSGDFLYAALHRMGVANQPTSDHLGDGLELRGAVIAATGHCAPPDNKPLPDELANCNVYLRRLLAIHRWDSILCLGGIAWNSAHRTLGAVPPKFAHGGTSEAAGVRIVGSYHPSQQNTFTGRLTPAMLDEAIREWLRD